MPAGGFRTFVAGEVLDEDDINDYLMQGVLVFGDSAVRGTALPTPVEGQVSFLTDSDTIEFYDGSDWIVLDPVPPGPDGEGTGGNSVETVDGFVYHDFTSSGVFTVTRAGTFEYILAAGGGGGDDDCGPAGGGGGGGGGALFGSIELETGSYAIGIGGGGARSTQGQVSTAFGLTAQGGGAGGGGTGGCGGGGSSQNPGSSTTFPGGTGNQGGDGGNGRYESDDNRRGGGGGGMGPQNYRDGENATLDAERAGSGGEGVQWNHFILCGGGGGGNRSKIPGSGRAGGGVGSASSLNAGHGARPGKPNSGSGGGGRSRIFNSQAGGSGRCVIRYVAE